MKRLQLKTVFLFLVFLFFFSQSVFAAKNFKMVYTGYMRDITKADMSGAYANLSSLLKHYRKNNTVLFVFGGNSLGPSVVANMDKGSHIIDILNLLEPDVYGLCDSDFTYSVEEFSVCAEDAVFPFVLTNVSYESGERLEGTLQNIILEKSGIKIGVMSILDKNIGARYLLDDLVVSDLEEAIEKNAKMMKKQGAEIVILLRTSNVMLSNNIIKNNIVDLILSKDPHSKRKSFDKKDGKIVLKGNNEVAVVDIYEKKGKIKFSVKMDMLSNYSADSNVEKIISNYKKSINTFLSEKIGVVKAGFRTKRDDVRIKENPFANFVADAIKDYTKADIAVINGGIIRGGKAYKKGDIIRRKDIFAELPFRNKLVLLEIEGRRILDVLENGLSLFEERDGRFLHVSSGMQVVYDTSLKPYHRIKKVLIDGKKLQTDKLYKLTVSDFMYKGGDNFDMLKQAKQIKSYNLNHQFIYDIVINHILKRKGIDAKFEKRLVNLSFGE